jgi:hypothetical protein
MISKKPKLDINNNSLFKILSLFVLFFSLSIFWAGSISDKGMILSFPVLGIITYVFSRLCIDENIEIHFIRAITIASTIISFSSLAVYFNINFLSFLGGNFFDTDYVFDQTMVFRSRPCGKLFLVSQCSLY